ESHISTQKQQQNSTPIPHSKRRLLKVKAEVYRHKETIILREQRVRCTNQKTKSSELRTETNEWEGEVRQDPGGSHNFFSIQNFHQTFISSKEYTSRQNEKFYKSEEQKKPIKLMWILSLVSLRKHRCRLQNIEKHQKKQGLSVMLICIEFEGTHGHVRLALNNKQINKLALTDCFLLNTLV
ncbi:hypothetical protein STEG23_024306, partial [Scotinomys teguina]